MKGWNTVAALFFRLVRTTILRAGGHGVSTAGPALAIGADAAHRVRARDVGASDDCMTAHASHPLKHRVSHPYTQRTNCMALMMKNGARISPAAWDAVCGFMARTCHRQGGGL